LILKLLHVQPEKVQNMSIFNDLLFFPSYDALPQVGIEPTTNRLRVDSSTTELLRHVLKFPI
jgi:hypothetical protein